MREAETVDLTDAQARELQRFAKRAKSMYDERQGGDEFVNKLRPLINELDDFDGQLRFGFGMKGDTREQIADIIQMEVDMEKRKNREGWGIDGRKLNAAENALAELRNAKTVEVA